MTEDDVDAFVGITVEQARALDPWRATRLLKGALRTLQRKGRITAERTVRLVEEIKQVVKRGKDPRRN